MRPSINSASFLLIISLFSHPETQTRDRAFNPRQAPYPYAYAFSVLPNRNLFITSVLFIDLLKHYDTLLPPTISRKKRESERKVPIRKRTAPIDLRVSRSRISIGADVKQLLAAQQAAAQGSSHPHFHRLLFLRIYRVMLRNLSHLRYHPRTMKHPGHLHLPINRKLYLLSPKPEDPHLHHQPNIKAWHLV